MKVNKTIILAAVLAVLSALFVLSQIPALSIDEDTNTFSASKVSEINDKISVEERQDCTISYYNSTQDVYGYVPRIRDTYGICLNPANQSNYTCVTGTESYQSYEVIGNVPFLKNTTACHSKSFIVSVAKGSEIEKKEIDYYGWGVCIQEIEGNCLAITCGTLSGGSAWNGIFNGCDGGKSCQKFLFCENGMKVFYKASREDFAEEDTTYKLSKLIAKEVGR